MNHSSVSARPLTGRKVFAITATFFGVIIAVNLFMARQAISTFSGLEVKNSYIASQHFNADRDAQVALGWQVNADVQGDMLVIAFTDSAGAPVEVADLRATLGRATHVREDQTPDFAYYNGIFTAPVAVAPGNWNVRLVATAPDGTTFRQRVVLYVKG
ncbi:FixH family protein [Plastorhodobacter daqingensis]|uniref:FixH family protein n=1 Tax=Plastorhodobacter daqingensis TaxID=1387281 RepID=A0ABW2UR09_9RHOB